MRAIDQNPRHKTKLFQPLMRFGNRRAVIIGRSIRSAKHKMRKGVAAALLCRQSSLITQSEKRMLRRSGEQAVNTPFDVTFEPVFKTYNERHCRGKLPMRLRRGGARPDKSPADQIFKIGCDKRI